MNCILSHLCSTAALMWSRLRIYQSQHEKYNHGDPNSHDHRASYMISTINNSSVDGRCVVADPSPKYWVLACLVPPVILHYLEFIS